MNKIVREHYPVESLPDDLRGLVADATSVTIELTKENSPVLRPLSRAEALQMMLQAQSKNRAKGKTLAEGEAVARIRALRDEWDD